MATLGVISLVLLGISVIASCIALADGGLIHDDPLYYFRKIWQVGSPLGNLDDIDTAELFEMAQKVKTRKAGASKNLAEAVLEGNKGTRYREQVRNHTRSLRQLNRTLQKRGAERP